MDKEFKKTTVRVKIDDWEIFKKITKYLESDSNKEVRKLVSLYLAQHPDLCEKFKKELEA